MEQGIKLALFNQLLALENEQTVAQDRLAAYRNGGKAISNVELLHTLERENAVLFGKVESVYQTFVTLGINKEYIEWSYEQSKEA